MDESEIWAAIDQQRRRTVALLEDLAEREWERPSLCEGWTVRDVAAHLTMQSMTLGDALRMMLRHPGCVGGVNHVINASARVRGQLPTAQLVNDVRASIGVHRSNVSVTPLETLLDITVHGQDMAVPLGRELRADPGATALAADRAWSYAATRKGRRKAKVFRPVGFTRFRLVADDTDWAAGKGPEVRGPVLALLLLLTGRTVVVPTLTGPGAATLTGDLGLAPRS